MSTTRTFPQVSLGTPLWMQSATPSTIELILPNTNRVEIASDLTVGNNIYVTSSKDKKKGNK